MRQHSGWRADVEVAEHRAQHGTVCDNCHTAPATVNIRSSALYISTFRCDAETCRAIEQQLRAGGHRFTVDALRRRSQAD